MKLNEKYFLNSLFSVAPRCALLPSVVGAYNTAYAVRGSARPSPIFLLPLVAKTSHTLERCVKWPTKITSKYEKKNYTNYVLNYCNKLNCRNNRFI